MLDTFYYGEAHRISPEAPIPILHVTKMTQTLGGAGNVANNLRALGVKTSLVGSIGNDEAGRKLKGILTQKGIEDDGLVISSATQTIVKNRYIAQDQQLLRVDFEETRGVEASVLNALLEKATRFLEEADVLILSDYGKGALPPFMIQSLLKQAQDLKKISIVDPKGTDYTVYRGATFVTPNRKELQEATGLLTKKDEEVVEASQQLIEKCGIFNVLATRSEKGMTLVKENGEVHHFPVVAREVYDVSGAGDTVVSTLAAALSVGDTVEEAVQLANLAGGVVVGKVGTATVSLQELEEAMTLQDQLDMGGGKIMTLAQAEKKVQEWKHRGLKVGFTNGCFDLLHLGHLKVLSEARALCDKLIVAVNKDHSIKRLKGEERPIQNETTRSSVLAALACVDLVILFEEDTPQNLITKLLPNILIKGGDYTASSIVGADVVQKNGGVVYIVSLMEGQSTTATVSKIQQLAQIS